MRREPFSFNPALALLGHGTQRKPSAFQPLIALAFIAGEGVSRKIVEVGDAMKKLVDDLRREVEGKAGRDLVDKLDHEVQRLAEVQAHKLESGDNS